MTAKRHLDTLAIHAGQSPDPTTGAVMTPIYQTSTYAQNRPGTNPWGYARTNNPTRSALQDCIAALEKGQYGTVFSSGVSAIDAVIRLLSQEIWLSVGMIYTVEHIDSLPKSGRDTV